MPNAHDRVTIAGTLYHQIAGQNPTSVSLRCTTHLLTDEQVYSRSPSKGIGPKWELLKFGWIENPSVLIVKNEEEVDRKKDPEEWRESIIWIELDSDPNELVDSSKEVVAILPPTLYIPPGMISILYPAGPLCIASGGSESVRYSLTALPE